MKREIVRDVFVSVAIVGAIVAACLITGCTSASTEQAIDAHKRVDAVRSALFQNQSYNLEEKTARMAAESMKLTPEQTQIFLSYRADRDIYQEWALQELAARLLDRGTVGTYLESKRGLWKRFTQQAAELNAASRTAATVREMAPITTSQPAESQGN